MTTNTPIIDDALLKTWGACRDGLEGFVKLFPNGATLPDAIAGLVADGHDDWGFWLFEKCRQQKLYSNFVAIGYRNAGDGNAGDRNAGDGNAGYRNAGNWNAGDRNAGYRNAGYRNAGDRNAGDRNAGDRNAGNWNAGNWNAGNWNAGHFNTVTPTTIRAFNKDCPIDAWNAAVLPNFLFFDLTTWVADNEMSDQEKIDNPKFHVAGGYLKTMPYKEAFKASWDRADKADRELLFKLPNFDANVFFEISGIDVRGVK